MEADLGTKALTSARLEKKKKELGMAANTGAEAHQEGGGEPAPDAGAPTAGGERGAMPASNAIQAQRSKQRKQV